MSNTNAWWIAGVVGVVLVVFAIGVAIANSGGGDLEGRTWTLEGIADAATGDLAAPLLGVAVTAQFASEEITGDAGCNSYFGSYRTDGDAIEIGPLGATQAFCEGIQEQEDRYLALLQAATRFAVDDSTLTLSDEGTVVLEFAD